MKRLLAALLTGGVIVAASAGLAATLDVNGGAAQVGSDLDLACDEDGVYVSQWNLNPNTSVVTSVRVAGIDEGCRVGDTDLFVELKHFGFHLVSGKYDNIDAAEVDVPLDFPMAAWSITSIDVFIEGEAND